ncbi:MAG: hypothetical protein JSU94_11305 [Phycisphaerales bacterium]|nr:MAG: hypothetical protein JSU94_11305 [Phycisphaerales bacterium]
MARQQFCQDCSQKETCQTIYEKLGKRPGPSVVLEVLFAFVAPVVVFIAFLTAFENIVGRTPDGDAWASVPGFLTALAGTFAFALIARAARRKLVAKKG